MLYYDDAFREVERRLNYFYKDLPIEPALAAAINSLYKEGLVGMNAAQNLADELGLGEFLTKPDNSD